MILKDNCPYCSRVETNNVEGEFRDCVFFLPDFVATKGHLIFAPKEHISPKDPIAWLDANMAMAAAVKMYRIDQDRHPDFNMILNVGPSADQTVEHLHVHYIPRFAGDGLLLPWSRQLRH